MDMFGYILGSGIMNKPYVFEIAICISFMVLFVLISWYACKKATMGPQLRLVSTIVCGAIVIMAFFFLFHADAFYVNEKKPESFEKVEYENHEYLIYKDREIFHNPNCPCRKMSNLKRECQ